MTTYRYHSSLVCIYSVNALLTTSSYFASLTVTPKVSNWMWYILVCIRPVIDRTNMMSIDCWIVWSVSETQHSILGGIMGSTPFVCWPTSDFYSIWHDSVAEILDLWLIVRTRKMPSSKNQSIIFVVETFGGGNTRFYVPPCLESDVWLIYFFCNNNILTPFFYLFKATGIYQWTSDILWWEHFLFFTKILLSRNNNENNRGLKSNNKQMLQLINN